MNEGTLGQWIVPDGATVTEGQPLYTLESEKAAEDIPAPASGRLRIIGQPGQLYQVGDLIGELE